MTSEFSPTRRVLLAAALAFAAGAPAFGQGRALSADDAADVARAETYLDAIRTLESRFVQIGPDGSVAEGVFLLSRPGKMRLEYDAPNPNLLVSDGRAFVHIDKALQTIAYLPVDSTPAGLFLRERIRFAGDVGVTGIERGPAVLRIALVQTADPRAGRLTLVFSERPFGLASWSVTDAQGLVTRLTLIAPQVGAPIDPKQFTFVDPNQNRPQQR
jgi:outer membrane lipoprotein-sorting protein